MAPCGYFPKLVFSAAALLRGKAVCVRQPGGGAREARPGHVSRQLCCPGAQGGPGEGPQPAGRHGVHAVPGG